MAALTLRPLQVRLQAFYGVEPWVNIDDFACFSESNERETLLLRSSKEVLEIRLVLPKAAEELQNTDLEALDVAGPGADLWAQVIEGVSHFVLLLERVRMRLPTTHLELEMQAEVDKYLMFACPFTQHPQAPDLHQRLFSRVRFLESAQCESGARYRLANRLAARYTAALFGRGPRPDAARQLRRFFRAGQAEKIHMARAA